jgi:DNA-binding response OmpR family regulator
LWASWEQPVGSLIKPNSVIYANGDKGLSRFFLVDDDEDDLELLSIALKKIQPQIECEKVSDPVEGLDILRTKTETVPDCIFLDINMPRINGIECLKAIKKMDHLQQTPVIMCSTSSDPRDIQMSREYGATDFVTKPLQMSAFVNRLSEVLKQIKAH